MFNCTREKSEKKKKQQQQQWQRRPCNRFAFHWNRDGKVRSLIMWDWRCDDWRCVSSHRNFSASPFIPPSHNINLMALPLLWCYSLACVCALSIQQLASAKRNEVHNSIQSSHTEIPKVQKSYSEMLRDSMRFLWAISKVQSLAKFAVIIK